MSEETAAQHATNRKVQRHERSRLVWIIPLAALAVLVALYLLWPGFQGFVNRAYVLLTHGERERVEAWVRGFGPWGPVVILAIMVMQALLAFIPSLLITVATVLAYGALWGGLLAWAGLLLAAAVGYGVGWAFGPVTVDRLVGQATKRRMERFVARYGSWAVLVARASPLLSSDAVSYVAGLVKMNFLRFVLATAVGILPFIVMVAFLSSDLDRLATGLGWATVASLVLLGAYLGLRRVKRTRHRR